MGNNKQHVVVVVVVRHVVHPEYEYISAITLEARMDHRKLKVQGVAGFWHERWWALTMTDVAKGRQLLGQAAQRSLTWQSRREGGSTRVEGLVLGSILSMFVPA